MAKKDEDKLVSRPSLTGEEIEELKAKYGQQKVTSLANPGATIDATKATDLYKQALAKDPRVAAMMKDKLAVAAGLMPNTGRDVALDDYYVRIRGANPNLGEPTLVPGQKEIIDDVQKVKQLPNNPEMSGKVFGSPDASQPTKVIKNVTDHIANDKIKSTTQAEFAQKLADIDMNRNAKLAALQAMKKGGKNLLSALPIVGGVASAVMSGDASAALPIPESAPLGYVGDSPEARLEKGQISPDEYSRLRNMIRKK